MRVLDEIADAFHTARHRREPRPILSSIRLDDQFGYPITDARWRAVERRLGCPLPPLEFDQGHWWLPPGLETVWDLATYVEHLRPDWEPAARTTAAWRDAQVFAGVREVLVMAGNLDESTVVREARLRADLLME